MANALDRLKGINSGFLKPVSLDDQLDTEDDGFLNSMSDDSKQALLSKISPSYDLDDVGDDDFLNSSSPMIDNLDDDIVDDNSSLTDETEFDTASNQAEPELVEEELFNSDNTTTEEDLSTQEEIIASEEEVSERSKPRRGRPAKQKTVTEEQSMNKEAKVNPKVVSNLVDYDAFIKSIALDFIDELDTTNYVFKNFTKQQMDIMLNYIRVCINK